MSTCPGCRAELAELDGPAHRYIGASPACWGIYTRVLAGRTPDSRWGLLLADAYAAQHPGGSSPQATQSVAVHLVTLAAVLLHGHAPSRSVALRRAAVEVGRRSGGYPTLRPVPSRWPVTVAELARSPTADVVDRMVEGVLDQWRVIHDDQVGAWYDAALPLLGGSGGRGRR